MARPKAKIDAEQVKKLAMLQCTNAEIASFFDAHVRTIERRFAVLIAQGREFGRMSLKRKQYEVAIDGNVQMLIWLGKQHLGQRDKSEIDISKLPDDVFAQEAERRLNGDKIS